jgi:hypothetical protein
MGKTNSTFVRPLWMASLFALAMLLTPAAVFAQATGTGEGCQDNIYVTLNASCEFAVDADNVVAGDAPQGYEVVVNDGQIEPMERNVINGVGTFEYGLFDDDDLICWGNITSEDKTAPVWDDVLPSPTFTCDLIDDILNNDDSYDVYDPADGDVGHPLMNNGADGLDGADDNGVWVTDNCGPITITWADNIEYFNCTEGDLYARITRRYTATDDYGNSSTKTQIIEFYEYELQANILGTGSNEANDSDTNNGLDPDVFQWKAETTSDYTFGFDPMDEKWVLTYQSCSPADVDAPFVYPSALNTLGDDVYLNEDLCNFSISEEEKRFDICGGGYKLERTIKVFDWCQSMTVTEFKYVVKVGDFDPPLFEDCVFVSGDVVDGNVQNFDNLTLSDPNTILGVLNTLDGGDAIDPNDVDPEDDFCTSIMVSTGPMNCTAAINSDLDALRAQFGTDIVTDCEDPSITVEVLTYAPEMISGFPTGDTVWTIGGYVRQGQMILGLPKGFHALVISASDGCYNSALGIVFFQVVDLVRPVMKCDDELRVTLVEGDVKLGINGYALATAAEVDEGSWDNCGLVDLHVRREIDGDAAVDYQKKYIDTEYSLDEDDVEDGYTPWRDIVEFFCADVTAIGPDDGGVRVELRGTDSEDNESICWLDVEVENGTTFEVVLEGEDEVIDCSEIPANLEEINSTWVEAKFGIRASVQSLTRCDVATADVTVDYSGLNQCGIGSIYVSVDEASVTEIETKNRVVIDRKVIEITVEGHHDYWVKFPADDSYFCADEMAAGVEYETNSCDLITVYENDEVFESVADPDACYKIFRTYKVINWCEYDSESLPVIVSRDWDAHNATSCTNNRNAAQENPDDTRDAGEYNLNPLEPDGDGDPGDEDIYVIVDVNNADAQSLDIVYYDNDSNPFNTSTANEWGDPSPNFNAPWGASRVTNNRFDEGYWWAVVRGESSCEDTDQSAWYDDDDDPANPDVDGNDEQDDSDNRYGSFGYWQYTQHIVVYDDTDPELIVDIDEESLCSIDGEGCDANVEFTTTVTDACSTDFFTVTYNVNGGTETAMTDDDGDGTYDATFRDAPLGKHILTVTVTDGCGNVADYTEEFEVVDCKGPAPICHDGIVVELMPTEDGAGMAEVWASDLIASPINDCTALSNDAAGLGEVPVEAYSIFLNEGFVDYETAAADADDQTGLFFTCTDAGTEPMVRVYAEDEAGNVDYCLTFVRVQDNNSICAPAAGGSIAGAVATETAANVEGVEVQLSGARSMMYMTDASGSFGFDGLAQGGDYTVTPQKDLNHLNGVSTFDLVLISKHILGVSQLDSPYKMIAADVNNSQSITTLDLIQLRKLILNIDTEFANNTSWRFIDKSHVFADPSNPWSAPIPEFKNINNLVDNAEAEFVATKIGDVNGSATVEARAATGDFAINTAEQAMIAGNEYTIDFSADMNDIAGYQFTLDVAKAEIVDVIYGAAKAENFGVFTKEGVITTSFNGEAAGTLFSVVVRATADTKVSEAIQISSRYTAAEAYTNDAEQLNVNLNVAGATAAEAAFALEQNTPNPFQGETLIGFNLPEAQEATITLQDVAGRTVKMIEGDFTKGYNQVTISANDLPSAGVYFYTLTAGDKSATKKLILVDAVNR